MLRILFFLLVVLAAPLSAQSYGPLQTALQAEPDLVERASRRTVNDVLARLAYTESPNLQAFLEAWSDRRVVMRGADGLFFIAEKDGDTYVLTDIDTGATSQLPRDDAKELRPNAGVRRVIGTALIEFQLNDPRRDARIDALTALERAGSAKLLEPLRASMVDEPDTEVAAMKAALERRLTARFDPDPAARIAAIGDMSDSIAIEDRAALSRILSTDIKVVAGTPPDTDNVARVLTPGDDLPLAEAHALLVEAGLAKAPVTPEDRDAALIAAIEGATVAGVPVSSLNDESARWAAYGTLSGATRPETGWGTIPTSDFDDITIFERFDEPNRDVTDAAEAASWAVETRLALHQTADLGLDALSLASIYFLAAVGLAVTFGVMGVINMAHGEFIMIGAYTGYVVQTIIPDYTLSLIVALPLAFLIAGAAGVALERLVIRHLMHRPLETLLATFGISIALQQIAKNIFGTQARPLTSPDWLAGSWVISDAISISWIRVAIFLLALVFLTAIVLVLKRTRLGLEVRAVTQNPGMAASMGIDSGRIGMLTFGLGSGIAGVAGVAIGLYAQVTSEMGAGYIVQSFMTVVVGGVGSVIGTLAGAGLIGGMQKGIEWLNPSNTLAAQTYMILFVIAFIQFRPRGIVPQKGRFAK
ncbi:MAG: urea ABC transporter permease subunit UrtB [Roseovarius sp.]|nr:urea ABC transporter permease subunit UrtB [Roseovarius sp.]